MPTLRKQIIEYFKLRFNEYSTQSSTWHISVKVPFLIKALQQKVILLLILYKYKAYYETVKPISRLRPTNKVKTLPPIWHTVLIKYDQILIIHTTADPCSNSLNQNNPSCSICRLIYLQPLVCESGCGRVWKIEFNHSETNKTVK